MIKLISSTQNTLVKKVALLSEKSRERKKNELFVVEGQREISLAIKGNYKIVSLLFCSEIISEKYFLKIKNEIKTEVEIIQVTKEVYGKMAYRNSTEGIIAIFKTKNIPLKNLLLPKKNALILVAEAPEKPGNIGALLRSADAAKVDAVIIANTKTDLFNPNIIRSSIGCVFTNQIATGTTEEIISFLKEQNIAIYCAALQASTPYYICNFTNSCAIVMGTEAKGLSKQWLDYSTQNIIIPMLGEIDSINVSVAAGILIFEAKRQRNFK